MADEREIPKIRTMRGDAEDLIKDRRVSQLDIKSKQYIAEKQERKIHFEELPLKKIAIFAAIILILGAGGYFGYKIYTRETSGGGAALEKPKPPPKIVAADDEKILSFKEALPGGLVSKINEERRRLLRFDTIIYFPIEMEARIGGKKFTDSRDFIKALSWRAPSAFLDNLFPEFNALIAHTSSSRDFSVIFRVRDFGRTVGSLIEWERVIAQDFKPFLEEEDAKNLHQFAFHDEVIKNNDSKVFKNSSGKTILAYTIFNKQFLIISTSRDGLSLILDRLIKLPPR